MALNSAVSKGETASADAQVGRFEKKTQKKLTSAVIFKLTQLNWKSGNQTS